MVLDAPWRGATRCGRVLQFPGRPLQARSPRLPGKFTRFPCPRYHPGAQTCYACRVKNARTLSRVLRASTLMGLTAGLAGAASAVSLLTFHGMSGSKYHAVNIRINSTNLSVYAGAQLISVTGYNGGANFDAYCVDLMNWQTSTPYAVNVLTTASLTNGAKIASLYNQYAGTVTNNIQGAALQLAIWETLIDGSGTDLDAGAFQYTSSGSTSNLIRTQTATYLAGAGTSTATYFSAVSHTGSKNQNLVGYAPVPEPFTMALAGAALGAAARRRRKSGSA